MIDLGKQKCLCINSFYWNITKPYFQFNEGEYYDFNVLLHEDNIKIYTLDFCSYISVEKKHLINFNTIEKVREDKLKKILGR